MGEDYSVEEVMVDIKVEAGQVEELRRTVQDATKGAGSVEELKEEK